MEALGGEKEIAETRNTKRKRITQRWKKEPKKWKRKKKQWLLLLKRKKQRKRTVVGDWKEYDITGYLLEELLWEC